jgi:very-short-patch-repair endonuclease
MQLARELRRQQTDEEKGLWLALRGRWFAGFKFRRQHEVGDHILDFYCAEAKLAVELDGFQAGLPEEIETLRFWNRQWRENREGCLLEIWSAVLQSLGCVRMVKKIKSAENKNSPTAWRGQGEICP